MPSVPNHHPGADSCPRCKCYSPVVDSRRAPDLDLIQGRREWAEALKPMLHGMPYRIRRYSCPACDHRWSSLEFRVPDLVTLLPERWWL